jgi:hypothetical protein
MGFFDRLLNPRAAAPRTDNTQVKPKSAKKQDAFFLDSDASTSLGDLNYMREAKTIRRTFPGTADSPGTKELVTEVDAMDLKVDVVSEGLGGVRKTEEAVSITQGIPKPVKKTFAEPMSQQELNQRLKGSALSGVNAPAPADAAPVARKTELKSEASASKPSSAQSAAPGSIDPFRAMVRDLNS